MLLYEILTNPGERDHNEDYAGVEKNGEAYCFVLADGLGGHGGGDVASRLVSEYILDDFARSGEVSQEYLQKCFEESQRLLREEQIKRRRTREMMTTLVVLLADSNTIQWGHIGDSRLYYFMDKKMKLRTLDHSVPQMLVAAGKLKEKKIRGHADRNRLLRVMGAEWDAPQYELAQQIERVGGEAFLLCTDGFWEWVEERGMQSALKKAAYPSEWLAQMEQAIRKRGTGKNMDNYSAVAVFL